MTQPTRLDPRIAWHIDARHLSTLMPHVDQQDLHDLRGLFARAIQASRTPHAHWQDAWNAWTGATPAHPGEIIFTPARCKECRGRGYNTRNIARNLSRTGNAYVCAECNGRRGGKRQRQVALYANPPAQDPA